MALANHAKVPKLDLFQKFAVVPRNVPIHSSPGAQIEELDTKLGRLGRKDAEHTAGVIHTEPQKA